jgi:hypothetical protein
MSRWFTTFKTFQPFQTFKTTLRISESDQKQAIGKSRLLKNSVFTLRPGARRTEFAVNS